MLSRRAGVRALACAVATCLLLVFVSAASAMERIVVAGGGFQTAIRHPHADRGTAGSWIASRAWRSRPLGQRPPAASKGDCDVGCGNKSGSSRRSRVAFGTGRAIPGATAEWPRRVEPHGSVAPS